MLEYLLRDADVTWYTSGALLRIGDLQLLKSDVNLYRRRDHDTPFSTWELINYPAISGLAIHHNIFLVCTSNSTWRYDDSQRKLMPCTLVSL